MATTSTDQNPPLPSYTHSQLHSQLQSTSIQDDTVGSSDDKHSGSKTTHDILSPVKTARMSLESLLANLEKELSNVIILLQNYIGHVDKRRQFYVDLNLMELFDVSQPVSLTILRDERARLLNRRQELKLKIVEKIGKSSGGRVVVIYNDHSRWFSLIDG